MQRISNLRRHCFPDLLQAESRLMPTQNIILQRDSSNIEASKMPCSLIPEERQSLEQKFEHCYLEQRPAPLVLQRSKTVGHMNLRKSLAWDKAFLTGEGVLDLDKLIVPPQRSKRLPELPTIELSGFDGNSLPHQYKLVHGSQRRLLVMDKCSPDELKHTELPTELPGKRIKGLNTKFLDKVEASGTIPILINTSGQNSDPFVRLQEAAKGIIKPSSLSGPNEKNSVEASVSALSRAMITKPIPIKTVIEAALQKGTRLRLPSSFIRKSEEKTSNCCQKMCINEHEDACSRREASASSILTSKVSAVSKKVKESLAKVFPERTLCENHQHAESLSTMPWAAPLSTTLMPKNEVVCTTRKYDSDAIKPKSTLLENSKLKKISSRGIISSNSKAPCLPVSMKGLLSPTAADTPNKSCTISASSKYGSNVGEDCTKNYKCTNSAGNLSVSSWKSKPSGLRTPSPKLGFFNSARVLTGAQPLIMSEKADFVGAESSLDLEKYGQSRLCADTTSTCNRGSKHFLKLKTHGLPTWKPSQRFSEKRAPDIQVRAVCSSIPSAPHLRFTGNASFPNAPSEEHKSLSLVSLGKSVTGKLEPLALDRNTYEVGQIFSEQTTAEKVKHDMPAYREEASEHMKSSIEVINGDGLPDRVVTSREDQKQCSLESLSSHTNMGGVAVEESSHTNMGGVAVEESSVPSLANRHLKDGMAGFPSSLHSNVNTLKSPPGEAYTLDYETNTSTVVDNLDRLDSISEMSRRPPLVGEQKPVDGICSVECSNGGTSTDIGGQDGFLAQLSQVQKEEKPSPAFSQGAPHSLDIQDVKCKEIDKSTTFCSSESMNENQEKKDALGDSPPHWLDWPVLKASAQKPGMLKPSIPSNIDLDNLLLACTDKASQQSDQPSSRSPLSANEQLLNVTSRQNKDLHLTVSKFTSLDSLNATLFSERNEFLGDFNIYHGADKGKIVSHKGPTTKNANSKFLSRKCASKENDFTPETIDLEELAKSRGPVVHSPPNKTSPRPGPWSPVRRNMQQLGPFDCTKYLNSVVQRREE